MMLQVAKAQLKDRLSPTDLSVAAGERIALVGPNGSGKTSLLRVLAGIDGTAATLDLTEQALADKSPAQRAKLLSYLPASRQLYWPIPVAELLRLAPVAPEETRVEMLINTLELTPFLDRPSNALSTGERARVLLARALAGQPAILLLDEPLANLDPYWVLKIVDLLQAEAKAGATVIAALHDLAQLHAFDRCILMDGGKIVADGESKKVAGEAIFAATFKLRKSEAGWTL